jgi:iron complex outermembrane recepter protein
MFNVGRAICLPLLAVLGAGRLAALGDSVHELPPFPVNAYWLVDAASGARGNVTVLDTQLIAESTGTSVADLLQTHAGVLLRSSTGNPLRAEPDLRGFGDNAGLRTLILVDGQRLNRPDMGVASWLEIPLGHIERIEVLRGSQAARHGQHAMGGVINIVTRADAPTTARQRVELAAGDYATASGRYGLAWRIGNLDTNLALDHARSDGYRHNSGYRASNARLTIGDRRAAVAWRLGLHHSDDLTQFPGPLGTADYHADPRQSVYTRFGVADQYFASGRKSGIDSHLRWPDAGSGQAELAASATRRTLQWNMGAGYHVNNQLDALTIKPVWIRQTARGRWTLGGEWATDRIGVQSFADLARTAPRERHRLTRSLQSAFAEYQFALTKQQQLTVAARHERMALDARTLDRSPLGQTLDQRQSRSEPALDVGWQFTAGTAWSAWLRGGRMARFPVVDEIASYQGYPMAVPYNAGLRPESGAHAEAGIAWINGPWTLRSALFALYIDGEIGFDYRANLNVNFADTRRHGAEWTMQWTGQRVSLQLIAAWIDARLRSGPFAARRVPLVPAWRGSFVATWRPVPSFHLQFEYLANSQAWEGNDFANVRPPLPGWQVAHVAARWQLSPHWQLWLRVNNVLDQRYATLKYSGSWSPAPARHWSAGIRTTF